MHLGKKYACVKCDKSYMAKRKLEDHYASKHTGRPRYQCQTCGKKFFYINGYRNHNKHLHPIEYAQTLASKGVSSFPINELYSMVGCVVFNGENGNDSKDLCCEICHRTFASKLRFDQHMKIVHKKNVIGTLVCTKCDNIHDTKNELEDHYVSDHLGVIRYACEFCGNGFSWREAYFRHRKEQHPTEFEVLVKQYSTDTITYNKLNVEDDLNAILTNDTVCERSCVMCVQIFPTENELHLHMQSLHSTPEKFACKQCFKKFTIGSHLELHLAEMHVGKPWVRCELCGDIFDSKSKYCFHHKRKHPKEYAKLIQEKSCNQLYEIDGYTIVERVSLENELSVLRDSNDEQDAVIIKIEPSAGEPVDHSVHEDGIAEVQNTDSESTTHRCKLCRKTFRNNRNLSKHLKDEHQKRKHQCDTCEKSFSTPRHLEEHKFYAHYKKPLYRCTLCGKTFFTNPPSFFHRRKYHYEELERAEKPLPSYAFIERLRD
ncbi:zinc finger protein 845-like [Uranotaenia lowii]|uniref:zinc finger protein 845-like n=1 Tax=Uranotaenia lowii TaxID=190385 RepID=UPI00247B2CCB|nr:zinc finger protein 845-like [Uranotaenia lowii]